MDHDELQHIRDEVAAAATVVAPSWPLSSIIAVNPLSGFEDRPFERALLDGRALFGTRGHLTLAEFRAALAADRLAPDDLEAALCRRLGAITADAREILLTDLVHGVDEPPPRRRLLTAAERHDRERGTHLRTRLDIDIADWCARWASRPDAGDLWGEWRAAHRRRGESLPADPAAALLDALDRLHVPANRPRSCLEAHLVALPGWSAHLRWRQARSGGDVMVGHLAVCTTLEADLLGGAGWYPDDQGPSPVPLAAVRERARAVADHLGRHDVDTIASTLALLPDEARAMVWLDAYERSLHDRLLGSLAGGRTRADRPEDDPLAQLVCCIDVRSEGLRRNLEACGPYETFGYAGFFGLAARFEPVTGGVGTDQYPVLLEPGMSLREVAVDGAEEQVERDLDRLHRAAAADDAWRAAKYHPIAPLALADGSGWIAGAVAAVRTASPATAAWVDDRLPHRQVDRAATTYDRGHLDGAEQAACVAAVVRIGLGPRLAPLVVLCGHRSRADNNPLESGLACGACGGNGGAPNARAVATMANDPAVRALLDQSGITITDRTWFLAAEHDTSTDEVTLLDLDRVPASHRELVGRLECDLEAAGRRALLDRAPTLPADDPGAAASERRLVRRTRRRGRDWAEPVAELGLAGNMAFVVGPRSLTRGLDLGRRVFLHSYDADADVDGTTLAGILTAPLVVAQWINAQYYFSTTDPDEFGAGTKTVHNVLGDIGVLSGPGGDLRRGLPLQSVRAGDRLLHEPARLLAVVQGSPDHIDAAIAGSTTLRRLVENEWIGLVARADGTEPWQRRTATGWAPHPLDPTIRAVATDAQPTLATR